MTNGIAQDASDDEVREAFAAAAARLSAVTGREYWVDVWSGFDSDDEGDDEWGLPVYAGCDDDLGHGVADARLDGWVEWLVEQAREG